jgi:O-antigen ligase
MVIASIYVLFCAAWLPWWVAQQHLGGRSIPFVLASCCYLAYAVISGAGVPMDSTTLIAGCIVAWLFASLIWSDTHKSIFEAFNMASYLILFTAARSVPLPLIAIGIFTTGTIFAAMQVYSAIRKEHLLATYFALGNGNHTGALMLVQFFVGVWLTVNLSLWFIPFVVLIAVCLVLSRCKGALLGTLIGGAIILVKSGLWPLAIIPICALFWHCRNLSVLKTSFLGRSTLYLAAIELIKKRPFHGFGLNVYRKEIMETKAVISRLNDDTLKRSHRAHNDHLEICAELGLTGYLLYVYLFSSIHYDTVTFALLIAFSIHALFFFPFREVHTAALFWAVIGAGAGGTLVPAAPPWQVVVVVCAITVVVIIETLKIFLGQWFSELAKSKPNLTPEEKMNYLDIAIKNDPYNGGYLTDAAFLQFNVNPMKSFLYSLRAFVNYEGERLKNEVYDLFARCLIHAQESNICHWVEDRALYIEPKDPGPVMVKKYLYAKEKELKEKLG